MACGSEIGVLRGVTTVGMVFFSLEKKPEAVGWLFQGGWYLNCSISASSILSDGWIPWFVRLFDTPLDLPCVMVFGRQARGSHGLMVKMGSNWCGHQDEFYRYGKMSQVALYEEQLKDMRIFLGTWEARKCMKRYFKSIESAKLWYLFEKIGFWHYWTVWFINLIRLYGWDVSLVWRFVSPVEVEIGPI